MEQVSIFEKFVLGQLKCDKIFENEYVIAINDIKPVADIHILVIPKTKFTSLLDCQGISSDFLGNFLKSINLVAKSQNVENYKVVFNNGIQAGQTVFYCHAHILSGKINKLEI